jgi:hypothetical protein
MCGKCNEIEKKISRYREFAAQPFDPETVGRIKELIADLQQKKRALHCDSPTPD